MRDYLLDIVKHTLPMNAFNQLRIDSGDTTTTISATEAERQLVVQAKTHAPIPQFQGTFGLPNLNLLNTLLNIPEYDDSATINFELKEAEEVVPFKLHFKNAAGDFENDFRLMSKKVIEDLEKLLALTAKFPVDFVPSMNSITRLKYQVSANPDEKTVQFDVNKGTVRVSVGDSSSHSGSFVFATGVDESSNYNFDVPSAYVLPALGMSGDKKIQIGELGLKITVDSGLVSYDYMIPMMAK
jgi:hypothetical protein